jgi:MFS family permease
VVVLQPVAINVTARFAQIPVFVTASVIIAIGIALTGVAHHPWSYAGTVVLWSIGEAAAGGVAGAIIASLAPADARGRYQGSFQWTWGVARFLALAVGTALYADVDPAVVWWFSAVAGVGSALGVGALGPMINRRTAEPEPVAVAVDQASAV